MPYLARSLSVSDYGTYGQALLSTDIVKTLFSGGLATIIFVYLSGANNKKQVISSNFFLSLILGTIGCVIVLLFSNQIGSLFDNDNLAVYIMIYSSSIIFAIPNTVLSSTLIFYREIRVYTKIIVFNNLLRLIFLLISIQILKSLVAVFISFVILEIIQFAFLYSSIKTRINFSHFNLPIGLQQLKKGLFLNLAGLLGYLTLTTDSVMISIICDKKEFAYYKNGAFEIPLISVLYIAISQIFLPKVIQWYTNNEFHKIIEIKKKLALNIAAITYPICVFFVLYSSDFIIIYLSDKYRESAIIFTLFNVSLLMRIYDYLDVLIAAKKTRLILYVQLFSIITNFVLNYILILILGIKGAAIATLITLFVYAFILLKINAKILNTTILNILEFQKLMSILFITLGIALPFYYVNIPTYNLLSFSLKLFYFPIIYFILVKYKFIDQTIIDYSKSKFHRKLY